jgi:hypothetical protein
VQGDEISDEQAETMSLLQAARPGGVFGATFPSPIALTEMGQAPLNTKGLSREKLLAACKILKDVRTDMRDIRQVMYELNDRLNNNVLLIEHVFRSLMR